jgi:hypothetical protein
MTEGTACSWDPRLGGNTGAGAGAEVRRLDVKQLIGNGSYQIAQGQLVHEFYWDWQQRGLRVVRTQWERQQ